MITSVWSSSLQIRWAWPSSTSTHSPGPATRVSPSMTHVALPDATIQCSARWWWYW